MTRQYHHNHTLQSDPWHCEEELRNNHKTTDRVKQPALSFLFRLLTHSNVQQKMTQTQYYTIVDSSRWYIIANTRV